MPLQNSKENIKMKFSNESKPKHFLIGEVFKTQLKNLKKFFNFQVSIHFHPKAVPELKFSAKPGEKKAEPFQIEIAILNCFRRRSFHELKKRSASVKGLIVHIKQNKIYY